MRAATLLHNACMAYDLFQLFARCLSKAFVARQNQIEMRDYLPIQRKAIAKGSFPVAILPHRS